MTRGKTRREEKSKRRRRRMRRKKRRKRRSDQTKVSDEILNFVYAVNTVFGCTLVDAY